MSTKIFVNLPVADLKRSIGFYVALGFKLNPQFTDDTAACIVISEEIYTMLLTHAKFREFTPRAIVNAEESTEVINCLSCESRGDVDRIVMSAISSGGSIHAEPKDYGFMYQHSFQDPDSHIWELVYMNPEHLQPQA